MVILCTNYEVQSAQYYKQSVKVIGLSVLEQKTFGGFLPYMGVAAILVM